MFFCFLFLGDSFVVFTISRHGTTTIPLGYSVVAALFVYSVLLSDGARFQNLLPTLKNDGRAWQPKHFGTRINYLLI